MDVNMVICVLLKSVENNENSLEQYVHVDYQIYSDEPHGSHVEDPLRPSNEDEPLHSFRCPSDESPKPFHATTCRWSETSVPVRWQRPYTGTFDKGKSRRAGGFAKA